MSQQFQPIFTGRYDSRIAQSNQASGYSGVIGIGIVGLFTIGATIQASDKDERYINCFFTKMGGKDYIIKRPGHATLNTPATGEVGSAILVWSGQGGGTKVVTAFGATNSTIYDGTTSLGAITGKARSLSQTEVGAAVPTIAIASGDSTGWYYDVATGAATKIADTDFPGNASRTTAGGFATLKGFNCIMDTTGRLYASDSNSLTAWTANSYDTDNDHPGIGIGAITYDDSQIITFKSGSMTFWVNAGLTPFPLRRTGQSYKIGAISWDAIAELAGTIFWCGSTDKGGLSIFKYNGTPERISTPEQDFQLLLAGPSNISLTTLRFYGRSFVLVKANTTTYVYCLEDKRWHEWSSTTPLWYKCAGLSTGSQILTYAISNIATTGKVYVINPASLVFTDDSVAYTATFQSAADDSGTPAQKFYEELMVDADREPSSSTLTISTSDDDYVTWVTRGTVDLSSHTRLTRLGASSRASGHKRAWKGTHSANTAMRIRALNYRASLGA